MQPSETKVQHNNFEPSYASALKKNNEKPRINNDTNQISERPTLHQQLKPLKENKSEGIDQGNLPHNNQKRI